LPAAISLSLHCYIYNGRIITGANNFIVGSAGTVARTTGTSMETFEDFCRGSEQHFRSGHGEWIFTRYRECHCWYLPGGFHG